MNYQNYTVEDFLLDKNFRAWVENPSEDADAFWNGIIKDHPETKESILSAKDMLYKMKFEKHALKSDEVSALWKGILKEKDKSPERISFNNRVIPLPSSHASMVEGKASAQYRRSPWLVAASIAMFFVFASALLWFKVQSEGMLYHTSYGETKSISLPDGSVATLNANSSLRVPSSWSGNDAREVWLEGEAFFEVKKISQNDNLNTATPYKFVVHSEGVAVEVLGTEFNVNTRREKVQVVLSSGKVRLKWQENEMLMQPGELVEVSKNGKDVAQKIVKPEVFSSWKENHLLCDATTLKELAYTIEDRFGYEVVFEDQQLSSIEVSGTIPFDNIKTFELVISKLIKVHFERKGDKLLISK